MVVASDRPCRGLEIASTGGVSALLVDRREFGGFGPSFDRDGYSAALVAALEPYRLDLVAMAGFGTILTESMHEAYRTRIVNTHPSLLPAFKGWHAVTDALDAGVRETGCTIHVATLALDEGPVLLQGVVPIEEGDDEVSLHERIKQTERVLYPEAIRQALAHLVAHGRVVG